MLPAGSGQATNFSLTSSYIINNYLYYTNGGEIEDINLTSFVTFAAGPLGTLTSSLTNNIKIKNINNEIIISGDGAIEKIVFDVGGNASIVNIKNLTGGVAIFNNNFYYQNSNSVFEVLFDGSGSVVYANMDTSCASFKPVHHDEFVLVYICDGVVKVFDITRGTIHDLSTYGINLSPALDDITLLNSNGVEVSIYLAKGFINLKGDIEIESGKQFTLNLTNSAASYSLITEGARQIDKLLDGVFLSCSEDDAVIHNYLTGENQYLDDYFCFADQGSTIVRDSVNNKVFLPLIHMDPVGSPGLELYQIQL